MKIRDHLPSKTFAKIKFTMVSLNVGFQYLAKVSPKTFRELKTYEVHIFFPPEKFSQLYPTVVEPLEQYIVHSANRLSSRVFAATASLKAGSTLQTVRTRSLIY